MRWNDDQGRMPRSAGWKAFVAWALAGALLVFALLSGFSIGLFVLPLAGVIIEDDTAEPPPEP